MGSAVSEILWYLFKDNITRLFIKKKFVYDLVKANIIHPATQKHIEKYTSSPSHLG